jgi:nucleoid-associated protein YgaU
MSTSSPYDNARRITYSNGDESLEPVMTMPDISDTVHTILPGETLQSIANKYFGDSGRWGDIMLANNLVNPFEVKEYTQLIIPL